MGMGQVRAVNRSSAHAVRVCSTRRGMPLVPEDARWLRARSVVLTPGKAVDWHTTATREELLIVLRGHVELECQQDRAMSSMRQALRGRVRCWRVSAGQCAFVPPATVHRVANRSQAIARYIYVTAPA